MEGRFSQSWSHIIYSAMQAKWPVTIVPVAISTATHGLCGFSDKHCLGEQSMCPKSNAFYPQVHKKALCVPSQSATKVMKSVQ